MLLTEFVVVSTIDTPTTRMRLEPVPTVCDHETVVAVVVPLTTLLLESKVIAAWALKGRNKKSSKTQQKKKAPFGLLLTDVL